jgi:putative glutathione S-transferase
MYSCHDFSSIIDGVYRAGFATTQEAYESAVKDVFNALDKVEKLLEGKDYLVGDKLTEADIRLWVTIVRTPPLHIFRSDSYLNFCLSSGSV